jgi:glycosyltransferase involved in cell wall biosynthesis
VGLLIEVLEVSRTEGVLEGLRGHHLDAPKQGDVVEARAFDIAGWVLGTGAPVVAVELSEAGRVVERIPVDFLRPDVADAFPDVATGERSGFRSSVNMLGAVGELKLEVAATLKDGRRVTLAVLRGRRRWRQDLDPRRQSLVSVVITCYDQAHFLHESIESALAQTYSPTEVVVVDDGSTDNTAEIARRYSDVRYVYQQNRGLASARNTGLRFANGTFLVFLDADDRLLPQALETGIESLHEHPECAFVWGDYRLLSVEGSVISKPNESFVQTADFRALLERNYIHMHATVMFRRDAFEDVGGYDESLRVCEDYELYFRMVKDFAGLGHGKVVAAYRRHAGNLSRNSVLMLRTTLKVLRAQRPHLRDKEDRDAYRTGTRRYQNHFGHNVVRETAKSLGQHKPFEAVQGIVVLLRWHPRGLLSLLRR